MATLIRTAYSYVRFSTPDQLRGNSLQRQTEKTAAFATKNGWRLDTSLTLHDLGRSGFTPGKQTAMEAFLVAIEEGKVDEGSVLIIENLDRFSRGQPFDVLTDRLKKILKAGIEIATIEPDRRYTRENVNRIDTLMELVVYLSLAHEASKRKSDLATDNWKRKRARAIAKGEVLTKRCPAWIKVVDGKFQLVPKKAEAIEKIYQWCVDGLGARSIVHKLHAEKIQNIAYGTKRGCGTNWTLNYVELLLKTKAVIGEYQPMRLVGGVREPDGQPLTNYFPAAISEDLYYSAQAARKSRTKLRGPNGKGVANLFSGILFDARSGSTMRLVNSSAAEKKAGCFRRLASYHAELRIDRQAFHSWKYEHFEDSLLQFLSEVTVDQVRPKAKASRLPALEAKLAEINEAIADTQQRLTSKGNRSILLDTLERLDDERQKTETEIDEERAKQSKDQKTAAGEFVTAYELLRDAKGAEKERIRQKIKGVLRLLVKEIWCLIERYEGDEGQVIRTCTVQVFFESGMRQVVLVRDRSKFFAVGTRDKVLKLPKVDLRQWLKDKTPLYATVFGLPNGN